MDEDLRHAENLAFHPNVNTATVVLAAADFFSKFLPHTGHTPVFVRIEAEPEPPAEG